MYLEQGTVPCSARTYTYDKRGNITSAKTYKYNAGDLSDQTPTKSYTCTYKSGDDVWEDELVNATAIDENSSLLYDENGNPINYYGAKIKWSAGRQLSKISGVDEDGNEEVYASFIYDENGIRTSEQSTEPGMSWDFTTEDGVVTGRQNDNGKNYRFIYDENGRPTAFMLNDALYHYITNQMGDVIGVADADGNLALEYYYDAWGDSFTARPNSCDYDGKTGWNGAYRLYNDNPIKYRGYYFDHAIGLYYLQSRYFHTDINRFFNADDPDIARESKDVPVGMNLFAYCNNDPVNNVDPTGYFTVRRWMVSALLDGIFSLCGAYAAYYPVKNLAQYAAKKAVAGGFKSKLLKLLNVIGSKATKVAGEVLHKLRRLCVQWGAKSFKAFLDKKTASWVAQKFWGFIFSSSVKKFLTIAIDYLDIFLSPGGAMAGILDFAYDGKINNVLYRF